MTVLSVSAEIFACHSAACRPPTSGGTGGSGGGSKTGRVRGGKPSADEAHWMSKGKMVPGATPIGSTTRIKDGAVHMDGKQLTGKIRKTFGGYEATMRGTDYSNFNHKTGVREQNKVIGKTKTEVMRAAQERVQARKAYKAMTEAAAVGSTKAG